MLVHMGKATPDAKLEDSHETKTSRQETPTFEPSRMTQLPEGTNCLASSEDGRYLTLGHFQGFSVWCASSLICVTEWLQDRVEITSIQIVKMAQTAYLLGTIDDMGVARVFAYHGEDIHLLSVINIMEDINERSVCLTFEMSEGGDYGAASISCNGAVRLEVYRFPSEVWQKELEMALLQKKEPSVDVDLKWSPASLVFKITPPKTPTDGPHEDFFTHCLALDTHTSSSSQQTSDTDAGKRQKKNERRCTHHFLLPCAQFIGDNEAKPQSGTLAVAVCVWWSGSQNVFKYLLQSALKKKSDVEPVPDELWPNASEILCSAVSTSTRYVALGLDRGVICVWDRQSGSPLSVVLVSAADSAFLRMQFVENSPSSAADGSHSFFTEKVNILVMCKSRAIHTVTTGREIQSCTAQLTDSLRPKHSGDLPTVATSVPFLQSLVESLNVAETFKALNAKLPPLFVLQRNGEMFLQDAFNKTTACLLVPLATHSIASPFDPVFALNSRQQTLFIKAQDLSPSCSGPSPAETQSQLLVFRFGESDIIKQYIISPQQPTLNYVTPEEACDLYLLQRALSLDERNEALKQSWNRLSETAQQKPSRDTVS